MRVLNRIISIIPVVMFAVMVFACKESAVSQGNELSGYASFRDVPGVTTDEIKAIEAIQREYDFFVYGMTLSTEAFTGRDGEVKGYAAALCEWFTELFGIPFRPRLYEWPDLIAGLETKEIAFSGELTATPERHAMYYMTSGIASRPLKQYRIAGSRPTAEITKERLLRCGFIAGTATIDTVTAELKAGTFEVIQISDVSLVYPALKSGQIDAFYYSGTAEANFVQYRDLTVSYFYPLIYRPVSLATHDPALRPIISVVEKILEDGGLHYMTQLYNQKQQEYLKYKMQRQLSEEEHAYIQSHPVIPIGADPGNYPGCFYDKREGEWRGSFLDILDQVSELTGLTFRRVNNETTEWPAIYQMLRTGRVLLVPELIRTAERESQFLWPETVPMIDYYALISKHEYPDIKPNEILYVKVGLARNTAYTAIFRKWFPNHMNTVEYDSMEAAFDALQRGEVDMVMANQKRLQYLTHYLELPDYKANVVFEYAIDINFGFNKDEVILCSIVNKALGIIDVKGIMDNWMRKTYDYRSKLMEAQRPLLFGAIVLFLCVIILLTILFLRHHNEERRLESLVRERTGELNRYQQKLETALETAKAANRAKSAFLANMSHEIRTPMNSIVGFSELAIDGETSPKTKDYLGKIKTNAEWLLQIINNILDISKIESGKMELENIPFDLHDLFASCRTLIMPKAAEKGIMLHFYAEPSLGKRPLGDPTRLRQVLINLLSNAVKFTNTGMVKLHSNILNMSEKNIVIHFEVKDSGIGMTPEQIEKIFEPFMQAESGTTRKYGGTGLGLSITKNIVELMGGTLSVESTPGVGSKFSFELTFDTIDITDDDSSLRKIVFNEMEKPTFQGEILLCEDNAMNQQVICEHLARVGLKTVVADNGKIGVEMVQRRMEQGEKQFDLVFMDMHMPVMDGLEASSKILEMNAGVPVVAMTANVMSNDMEIYRKSGMRDCVGKPFTSQELWRCLMKYFKPLNWQTVDETRQAKAGHELQQKLTRNFLKDNQNRFHEITEAVAGGDIKLAHRLAHTLKGNAGQLGRTLLQQAAADVEHGLKDGNNLVTKAQMKLLEAELIQALHELPLLLDEDPLPAEAAEPFDTESARELIAQLEPMLEMGNPEGRKFIDRIRRIPGSETLIEQMEDLDFEPARVSLAELKKNLGNSVTR